MYITKEYFIDNLISCNTDLNERFEKVQNLTNNQNFFSIKEDKVIRYSKKIKGNTIKSRPGIEQLVELAKFLDNCFSEKLVHGDIHNKNIILQENKLYLIDWEPSLRQIFLNKNVLMYTAPWIDPEDKQNKELTPRTDLLCFHKLISAKSTHYSFYQTTTWNNLLNLCLSSIIPFSTILNQPKENT